MPLVVRLGVRNMGVIATHRNVIKVFKYLEGVVGLLLPRNSEENMIYLYSIIVTRKATP
jgi:hypothetical protein